MPLYYRIENIHCKNTHYYFIKARKLINHSLQFWKIYCFFWVHLWFNLLLYKIRTKKSRYWLKFQAPYSTVRYRQINNGLCNISYEDSLHQDEVILTFRAISCFFNTKDLMFLGILYYLRNEISTYSTFYYLKHLLVRTKMK